MRLLMTGLYENVSKLQNEKSLTFLYRTPKIQMDPLSIGAITSNYDTYLKIDYDKAIKLAKFTKGYAFAYQTLGFILFEKNKKNIDDEVLRLFDQQMDEFVYNKIYSEVSSTNKKILKAIAVDEPVKVSDIDAKLKKSSQYINVYRNYLLKDGI